MSVTKLVSRSLSGIALGAWLVMAAAPNIACVPRPVRGPSAVGQGELFRAGEPSFDEFFDLMHEEQGRLGRAQGKEKNIRKRLARKLGVKSSAKTTRLGKALAAITKKLEAAGTGVRLEISGADGTAVEEASARIATAGATTDDKTAGLLEDVQKAASRAAQLQASMNASTRNTTDLAERLKMLEAKAETSFPDAAQLQSVKKNLADAKELLPMMQERADSVRRRVKRLLKRLRKAAASDLSSFDAPKPAPPPPRPVAPPPTPAPSPDTAPAPAPGPAPAPKPPPPPPSSDFEP